MSSTERFGYEWDAFQEIIPEYEGQFRKWVAPLQPEDFRGLDILDVGCGTGRNSYWPCQYGAKRVVAIDVDERTLAVARKNLTPFPQAEVRACSAYDLNDENRYDLAFSIGVIHHLERPDEALRRMVKAVKPGGRVLVWVYGYEGNEWIVRWVNPLRRVLSRLPLSITNLFSYLFAAPLYLFVHLVPQKRPYYQQLATFRFWHLRSIVLDQLLPTVANYWTREEARGLLERAGLSELQVVPVNGLSWTVLGRKRL